MYIDLEIINEGSGNIEKEQGHDDGTHFLLFLQKL